MPWLNSLERARRTTRRAAALLPGARASDHPPRGRSAPRSARVGPPAARPLLCWLVGGRGGKLVSVSPSGTHVHPAAGHVNAARIALITLKNRGLRLPAKPADV